MTRQYDYLMGMIAEKLTTAQQLNKDEEGRKGAS